MPDPDLDLDALDALCAAATAGPWDYDRTSHAWVSGQLPGYRVTFVETQGENFTITGPIALCGLSDGDPLANAAFIAAARTALPALVARVRKLEAALQSYVEFCSAVVPGDDTEPPGGWVAFFASTAVE